MASTPGLETEMTVVIERHRLEEMLVMTASRMGHRGPLPLPLHESEPKAPGGGVLGLKGTMMTMFCLARSRAEFDLAQIDGTVPNHHLLVLLTQMAPLDSDKARCA